MIIKSYIFTTIAMLLALFINILFIILPICFIFAFIGLYYGVKNYIKNNDKYSFIVNVIPLACSGFVIVSLIFLSIILI